MSTEFTPSPQISRGRTKTECNAELQVGFSGARISRLLRPHKMGDYSLTLGTVSISLRARGRVLGADGACVRCRIRGALLRGLLCQCFKLVDEVSISGGTKILKLRGEVIDLLDLYFTQSECWEPGVQGKNFCFDIRCGRSLGGRCLPRRCGAE